MDATTIAARAAPGSVKIADLAGSLRQIAGEPLLNGCAGGEGLPEAPGVLHVAALVLERLEAERADMLAALRGLLSVSDRYTGVGLAEVSAARAAIAKAEGRDGAQ